RYAQELLSHQVPIGDIASVIDKALDVLITRIEGRKCGRTNQPRRASRPSANARYIPAHVRPAVWERDGGRCTFIGDTGNRCWSSQRLEFDHVLEVARGGQATVEGIRLRCRAHNQYGAECTFGTEFMNGKREQARAAAARATEKARALADRESAAE